MSPSPTSGLAQFQHRVLAVAGAVIAALAVIAMV